MGPHARSLVLNFEVRVVLLCAPISEANIPPNRSWADFAASLKTDPDN